MRHVLEGTEPWEIIEAENGEEAVAKAKDFRPDLVILDLAMPVMDGLTASREIAGLLPGVPILLHTLYSSPQVELEARKLGVRQVVPKAGSSVLISAVQNTLHTPVPSESPGRFSANRRAEDKIRELCNQLLAVKDETEHASALSELQKSLHQHIEHLRARVAKNTLALERRTRQGMPLSDAS
jgi:CheY-like chemotaxis protein